MKHLFTAIILTLSFSSFAETYKAKKMGCDELKETVANYRSIYVVHGLLGVSRGTMWADEKDADRHCEGAVQRPMVRTQDGFCLAGYMCENRSSR